MERHHDGLKEVFLSNQYHKKPDEDQIKIQTLSLKIFYAGLVANFNFAR